MNALTVVSMLSAESAGWIVRADKLGLRVTSRPGRFGDERYFVKTSGASIEIIQNKNVARKLNISGFTAPQLEIVSQLQSCGLVQGAATHQTPPPPRSARTERPDKL